MSTEDDLDRQLVDRIAAEVRGDAKDAKAIAVVIVRPDGDLRTLYAWGNSGKLSLIAGMNLLLNDMCSKERKFAEPNTVITPDGATRQ